MIILDEMNAKRICLIVLLAICGMACHVSQPIKSWQLQEQYQYNEYPGYAYAISFLESGEFVYTFSSQFEKWSGELKGNYAVADDHIMLYNYNNPVTTISSPVHEEKLSENEFVVLVKDWNDDQVIIGAECVVVNDGKIIFEGLSSIDGKLRLPQGISGLLQISYTGYDTIYHPLENQYESIGIYINEKKKYLIRDKVDIISDEEILVDLGLKEKTPFTSNQE